MITLAQLTGAPVLVAFLHRSPDYQHQVLEISPPVPIDGQTKTAFGRCAAAIDAAIRTSPAHWNFWFEAEVLARLGVLPAAPAIGTAALSRQLACFASLEPGVQPQTTRYLRCGPGSRHASRVRRSSREAYPAATSYLNACE